MNMRLTLLAGLFFPMVALAISPDNAPTSDPSVEAELASFVVHEEFEVSLFADEKLDIANPIAMHWDPRGRLWVLCTLAYAQMSPGQRADDKLVILEDTDGDGRADHSTVFADGLEMPTGFALGHGGAWVAEGTDLIHLRDTDGDDRSDQKRVILSGFGTGDTHQNISNLIFDAGGFLYFSQGLHCFSQVETPWGMARGDTAGFWRLDPRITRLAPFGFPSMVSQNPCGIAVDRWGAIFVKSNGPHLCFATPGLIPTTHPAELMEFAMVGQTPGKSMGGEIVESAHFPDWIQNHAIIAGYFAREVSAIPLVADGAGFAASAPVRLIYGGHESFRPVDVRKGPDGAIYLADWFNPVINHYQVSLRHPDRDYSHGRIWRISAKGRPALARPKLETMDLSGQIEQLRSSEPWPREQARRMLTDSATPEVVASQLSPWVSALGADEYQPLIEAAGVLESLDRITPELLDLLQASGEPRVRAVAARLLARSTKPQPGSEDRLRQLLADSHPRPRLEAVVACAARPGADSLKLALTALDAGTDRFVEYSLSQTVFALQDDWLPALREGRMTFEKSVHLAFVLEQMDGPESAELARNALTGNLAPEDRSRLLHVLAKRGGPEDASRIFTEAVETKDLRLLDALGEAAARGVRPKVPVEDSLKALFASDQENLRVAAVRLAGLWKVAPLAPEVQAFAVDSSAPAALRSGAMVALPLLMGDAAVSVLNPIVANGGTATELRRAALAALNKVNPPSAAKAIMSLLTAKAGESAAFELLPSLLEGNGGAAALAVELESGGALESVTAQKILDAMNRLGRTDAALTPLLNRAVGRQTGAPEYDAARVARLVAEVRAGHGDVKKGAEVFHLAQLACMACHRVGDEGGVIGPSLNGVGAGMPLDQIVESILWPDRQIKEGFQAVAFTTTAGASITGYIEREGDDIVWYRSTATPWTVPLSKKDIATREMIPTLMPAGLTASLSEEQLRDLVAYLASLKG